MIDAIDGLLKQYELGEMTRREILAAIALVAAAPEQASAQGGMFNARSINHLNVRVADLARSEAFYRKVLGLPAVRPVQGAAFALDLPGGGAISLCPLSVPTCGVKPNARPGDIDHVGIGIDNFEVERVAAQLTSAGLDGVRRAGSSVFLNDPDGTAIQLSAVDETYRIGK